MAQQDEPVSGKWACARLADGTTIYEITAWNYSRQANSPTYSSCETDGEINRVEGAGDITGSLELVFRGDESFKSILPVGSLVVLHLFSRKPVAGYDGLYDEIPVIIEGHSGGATVSGGPQTWSVSWAAKYTTANPAALYDQVAAAL